MIQSSETPQVNQLFLRINKKGAVQVNEESPRTEEVNKSLNRLPKLQALNLYQTIKFIKKHKLNDSVLFDDYETLNEKMEKIDPQEIKNYLKTSGLELNEEKMLINLGGCFASVRQLIKEIKEGNVWEMNVTDLKLEERSELSLAMERMVREYSAAAKAMADKQNEKK